MKYRFILYPSLIFLISSIVLIYYRSSEEDEQVTRFNRINRITTDDFNLFMEGQSFSDYPYFGRVLRGVRDEDFVSTSFDKDRRIVFFIGKDGLEKMKETSGRKILMDIGWESSFITGLVEDGKTKFIVFVFKSTNVQLATWGNVFDQILLLYGRDVYEKIEQHKEELMSSSLEEIQMKNDSFSITLASSYPHDDPFFFSAEKISGLSIQEVGVVEARAFLFHSIGINSLFTGTGFVSTENSSVRGSKEYIGENRYLTDYCGDDDDDGCFIVDLVVN